MFITNIESLMAEVSELFMVPVVLAILLLFVFSLFSLGRFLSQSLIRRKGANEYERQVTTGDTRLLSGFDIHNYFVQNSKASEEELEVFALKKLELLRIVTRISPMLGLIATMIPMGPALQSLADGNIQGISENLIIAFSAVIWGLVVSTLTFWPASVKKRWYANELLNVRKSRAWQTNDKAAPVPAIKDAA